MKKIILLFYLLITALSVRADYYGYPSNTQSMPPNNQYPNRYPSNYPPMNGGGAYGNPNYPSNMGNYGSNNGYGNPRINNYPPQDDRYKVRIRQHY